MVSLSLWFVHSGSGAKLVPGVSLPFWNGRCMKLIISYCWCLRKPGALPPSHRPSSQFFLNQEHRQFWCSGLLMWHHRTLHYTLHFGHEIVQCSPTLTSTQDLFQQNSWQTPVAAITVYSTPADWRRGRPKHVEHTCSFS